MRSKSSSPFFFFFLSFWTLLRSSAISSAVARDLLTLDVHVVAAEGGLALAMLVVLGLAGLVEELRVDDDFAHHAVGLLVHRGARLLHHLGDGRQRLVGAGRRAAHREQAEQHQ
jgi:hypothetical protein